MRFNPLLATVTSVILASSLSTPALAATSSNSNWEAATSQATPTQTITSTVVAATVPLTANGDVVTVDAGTGPVIIEELDIYQHETCTWSRDGMTWSTSRGGQPMTVTDALAYGVDVSEWQRDIDWHAAKASGVQFAILRAAYGTYKVDEYILQNVRGCQEAGIPFGIYTYSLAATVEEAAQEAMYTLQILSAAGISPDDLLYPVYYDLEDDVQLPLTDAERGDIAATFCGILQSYGYDVGIYANAHWFSTKLTDPRFEAWTKWVASYPTVGELDAKTVYTGGHDMWQCMSRGTVPGIPGRVDINFDYRFNESYYAPIYDFAYYMANNPDVAALYGGNRALAFSHFLHHGMSEGRSASPNFNLHGYFNSNPDLRQAFGLNLERYYIHYLELGRTAGLSMEDSRFPLGISTSMHIIDMSSIYDPFAYLTNNPDLEPTYVKRIGTDLYIDDFGLLRHFMTIGLQEGRAAK